MSMESELARLDAKRASSAIAADRPVVHQGEVLATLFGELQTVFRRVGMADAFEKKVTEAAKSPAAWLLLREELNPSKDPAP